MTEYRDSPVEINAGRGMQTLLAFSANGEHLIGGSDSWVRVWQVQDAKEMATLEAMNVKCLAVSGLDVVDSWIAAGTTGGDVIVWDAKTYKQRYTLSMAQLQYEGFFNFIHGIDFSPDATRLLSASFNGIAAIWDLSTGSDILRLRHDDWVKAAKYSPQGDRIATATDTHVHLWDSKDGHLLQEIPVEVAPYYNNGLLWSDDCIFVVSANKIKRIGASVCLEWPVPNGNHSSSIVLPKHGEFIACSGGRTITFWDTLSYTQAALIRHDQNINSIAISSDDQLIAISGEDGRIAIKRLAHIAEPDIQIDNAVLDLWRHDQFADAEALLTTAIPTSHHALACRALIRTHLGQLDAATNDAKESIDVQPSMLGYIAKSIVLISKGEKNSAYRACDIAFQYSQSTHVGFLLLNKAVIVFMAGEHDDALSRIDDLINMGPSNSMCYVVQAYMYFLLGNSYMEKGDYQSAIQSFEHARAQMRLHSTSQVLLMVSLISGWKFDKLSIDIRCRLCEAFYAAGQATEAGGLVVELVDTFGKEIYTSDSLISWVSDFTERCLNTSEFNVDAHSKFVKEWARAQLACGLWTDTLTAAASLKTPRFMTYRAICDCLETMGCILDATTCFLQIVSDTEAETSGEQEWAAAFRQRCTEKLKRQADVAADAHQYDSAIVLYSAALSLNLPIPHILIERSKAYMAKGMWKEALNDVNHMMTLPSCPWDYGRVLTEWADLNLMDGLWKHVLAAARDFDVPGFEVCRVLCESLERMGGIVDAIECFHQIEGEKMIQTTTQNEPEAEWVLGFRYRCSERVEHFGDAAMDGQKHDEAMKFYTAALSVHPAQTQCFSILQSKVCMVQTLWDDAVDHANEAIKLDPTSPLGFEAKHTALRMAGRFDSAIETFEAMLSSMDQSSDPQVRMRRDEYIEPSSIRAMIRRIVKRTIRRVPRVLINIATGHLQNKSEQETAFMSLPIVNELVSSMTTHIDRSRIKHEVQQFFRYVMLSHTWEENEPLFENVIHKAVYDLEKSPTHDKLKTFCKIVGDAGFNWAWCDTCCINKEESFVLQEALVAMFKWYRGAAMVFVFLRGVHSPGKVGDLMRSMWNTRAWTLQEYIAARVIRFYTEDWTPYLDLDIFNHKESPEIILEMEQATGESAQRLTTLRPGLSSIQEKLRLASTRNTTLEEDAAYSLLGIFSVSGISPIYGEREDAALGRLLAHILAVSGDTSILAWTGQSGGHNSCLPARIAVFNQLATSHLPPPLADIEIEAILRTLPNTTLNLDLAMRLYDRLSDLPAPWFAASRMKLPCIAFKLPHLLPERARSGRVYRVETPIFGTVEIKTRQDPSRLNYLYLVHPWIESLICREETQTDDFSENEDAEHSEPSLPDTDDDEDLDEESEEDPLPIRVRGSASPLAPVDTVSMDREMRALRLIARLRQPFGALLLSLTSTHRRARVYKRVAADSTITVQIQESVSLSDILDSVHILDVL